MLDETALMTQATYHNKLGLSYHSKKNYSEALKQFKAALQIAELIGDSNQQVLYLNYIGGIHKIQGNMHMALKIFSKILKIAKQQKNQLVEAISLNRIGLIYHNRGTHSKNSEQFTEALTSFKEAMSLYNSALEIALKLRNSDIVVVSLNNIAGLYKAQGNYQKALKTYQKALEILSELGLKDSLNAEKIRKNIVYLEKLMNEKSKANHHN